MSTSFPIPRDAARDPEHPLARAFASFTEAAGSLERTYGQLQGQVAHLRQELEVTNRDLAASVEENRRIRERQRRILEGLPCGVLVIEAGVRISALNPETARLLGSSFESADALPAALRTALDRARQTGEESELPLSHVDSSSANPSSNEASPIWVAIRHAWLEQSQSPAHATSVFILRDVSEAKKLEQDREQLRRQQALVEMSALLAHEIRNPLGSLELFAGLLAEANLEGESHRWIEHVQAGLRTLSSTVNNVLHLHNTPQPELAPTDLGQLLDWAYDFLLPLAKQARVEMQLMNGLRGVVVSADRHRLEQVLLNLALNAFRFMPGGGWLSIRGNDGGGDNIEIVMRDTGPGIVAEDLPRIFDVGFSTRAGSSGLGLAVCHRILEQHGGSIEAESRPGYGATFRLRLPPQRDYNRRWSCKFVLRYARGFAGICRSNCCRLRSRAMKRLLIADDDAGMRAALEARFQRRGWLVDVAVNGTEALAKFRAGLHSLVITDVRMPGRDGFELMREVQTSSARVAVILLTAYGSVPDAVAAMRNGACDYLVKPVCFEKLELAVEQVLRRAEEFGKNKDMKTLIGHSPAWEQAVERARQAASTDADVLIEAESGTGKELIARLIHRLSRRKSGPFVALNCAAFPETLLESELFGHARGAFTGAVGARPGKFETATGGTLLLDEVGEMPLALQPKLLRALQEREFDRLGSNQTVRVDIRVISTSNRPLEAAVAEGRFRADLYYRLNVIPISLPPLSDRAGDIRELADYFAGLYAAPGTGVHLSRELVACLEERAWPGNVRELANFVRRAVALSRGGEIGVEALAYGKSLPGKSLPPRVPCSPEWKAGLSLGEMERQLFAMTLESTGGNRARAAELLGVSLRTVRNKVREFGLPPRDNYRNGLLNSDLPNNDLRGNDLRSDDPRNHNHKEQPCP